MSDQQPPHAPRSVAAIERPAMRAERRLRLSRAFDWGTSASCGSLVAVAVVLVLRKTHHLHEGASKVALVSAAVLVLGAALIAYMRPLPAWAGAIALDRFHGLSDRLASALSFARLPPSARTPFMEAAISDALTVAPTVRPHMAAPLRMPRDWVAATGLACAVAIIAVFEVRVHSPPASARTIEPVEVTADDLDAMRDFLRKVQETDQSDEVKAATEEFNQLINDLAARHLDRTEAFRRMQALEDRLLEGRDADKKALEEAFQKIGEEMKKAELTRPAGEALDTKNLADASRALAELATKLREHGGNVDKQQLQSMRDALKKASESAQNREESLAKRRDELEKQLLQQKRSSPDGGAGEEEKSLLQKRERELERLSRQEQEQSQARRQLDRLDRELAQAAEDLMRDLGASAKDLDQGAEDINRMAKQEMTDEEKDQLRQKLEDLRQMLRQQGQGGQQQMVRLRRFQSRARGGGQQGGRGGQSQESQGPAQGGEGDESGQQGQQGQGGQQGQDGQQGQGQQGQNGQGQQGQGGQGNSGQNGQGQQAGSSGGETWILGPHGEKILMISQGQGGQGQGQGNGGSGQGQSGSNSWGTGHDGNLQGRATAPKVSTEDSQIAGQDTGQGASRSEVIQGAAERGFASRRYTKVYQEYHSVAEEALDKDEVPGGYRFYVRRYFELIRPRDGTSQAPPAASPPDEHR